MRWGLPPPAAKYDVTAAISSEAPGSPRRGMTSGGKWSLSAAPGTSTVAGL
eukprot:CAMPEP_0198527730 /NCGR_PEP_ID=MMETSP1462-20131121/24721_1 /TAXON_ID=1333877 /ORGANISM="Brandtodinium nutriculum, Strain RCC3387" /LENGTH=50 /DNA_ID=CAMNT_0044257541 /DNA_START=130 /DNA_END=278 /DNA_ORIENTATION=+